MTIRHKYPETYAHLLERCSLDALITASNAMGKHSPDPGCLYGATFGIDEHLLIEGIIRGFVALVHKTSDPAKITWLGIHCGLDPTFEHVFRTELYCTAITLRECFSKEHDCHFWTVTTPNLTIGHKLVTEPGEAAFDTAHFYPWCGLKGFETEGDALRFYIAANRSLDQYIGIGSWRRDMSKMMEDAMANYAPASEAATPFRGATL